MSSLVPWEPFEGLTPLREAINRLFEDSFVGLGRFEPFGRVFPLDVLEAKDEYVIEAALPGMKPEDVQVTATDTTIAIRAGTKAEPTEKETKEKETKEDTYVRRERYTGEVSRTIALPMRIVPDKVAATYEHGVLTLHVPKAEEAKPKTITVQMKVQEMTH